jgi:hypothetical protein
MENIWENESICTEHVQLFSYLYSLRNTVSQLFALYWVS